MLSTIILLTKIKISEIPSILNKNFAKRRSMIKMKTNTIMVTGVPTFVLLKSNMPPIIYNIPGIKKGKIYSRLEGKFLTIPDNTNHTVLSVTIQFHHKK